MPDKFFLSQAKALFEQIDKPEHKKTSAAKSTFAEMKKLFTSLSQDNLSEKEAAEKMQMLNGMVLSYCRTLDKNDPLLAQFRGMHAKLDRAHVDPFNPYLAQAIHLHYQGAINYILEEEVRKELINLKMDEPPTAERMRQISADIETMMREHSNGTRDMSMSDFMSLGAIKASLDSYRNHPSLTDPVTNHLLKDLNQKLIDISEKKSKLLSFGKAPDKSALQELQKQLQEVINMHRDGKPKDEVQKKLGEFRVSLVSTLRNEKTPREFIPQLNEMNGALGAAGIKPQTPQKTAGVTNEPAPDTEQPRGPRMR